MSELEGITTNPSILGGKPCIRGTRVTVTSIINLLAGGQTNAQILESHPYLVEKDIQAAVAFAVR
jgi:uncharacterized protein (DUF433 family)